MTTVHPALAPALTASALTASAPTVPAVSVPAPTARARSAVTARSAPRRSASAPPPRPALTAAPLDRAGLRQEVDAVLSDFLDERKSLAPGPEMGDLIEELRQGLAGGKRLRPLLCLAGWHIRGEGPVPAAVFRVAAALELFQAFALVHDDIMDASDLRRGRPAAHRSLANSYVAAGGQPGRADAHGLSAGLLLGDLALIWSDELVHSASLRAHQLRRVLRLLDSMRTEVVYGQYLDLIRSGLRASDPEAADPEAALRVARYKTATYTVQRPLQIGAAMAGASAARLAACERFAVPLGEAYQLRDDVLALFGDSALTGKPVLDDLREGKATVLIALALRAARGADRRLLRERLGAPDLDADDAARIRAVVESTGALADVEEMIHMRYRQAMSALKRARFAPAAAEFLSEIARTATERQA